MAIKSSSAPRPAVAGSHTGEHLIVKIKAKIFCSNIIPHEGHGRRYSTTITNLRIGETYHVRIQVLDRTTTAIFTSPEATATTSCARKFCIAIMLGKFAFQRRLHHQRTFALRRLIHRTCASSGRCHHRTRGIAPTHLSSFRCISLI